MNAVKKVFCWVQVVSGALGLIMLLILSPVYVSRLDSMLASVEELATGGRAMIRMSISLLEHTSAVTQQAQKTMDALNAGIPFMKTSTADISKNLKLWGNYTESLVGVSQKLSGLYKETAGYLPISFPTGIKVSKSQISLAGMAKLSYPDGIQPEYSPLFLAQKKKLEDTAAMLADLSRLLDQSTRLLKTSSGGLDKNIIQSLEASSQSLALAQKEMQELSTMTIPKFLAEMKALDNNFHDSRVALGVLHKSLVPICLALMGFCVLWSLNGLVLWSVIKK